MRFFNYQNLLLAIVLIGSLTCWLSFDRSLPGYGYLWTLQLSNTYSPFTKWESGAKRFFVTKLRFTVIDELGSETTSRGKDFVDQLPDNHMAAIPFRIAHFMLLRKKREKQIATDILRYVACNEPKKFFNYQGNSKIVSLRILYVWGDQSTNKVEIPCGEK